MGSGSSEAPPLRRPIPRLHVVTDDAVLAGRGVNGDSEDGVEAFIAAATRVIEAAAGDLALHLRGPRTSGQVLYRLARALAPVAAQAGALLQISDRADVAAAISVETGRSVGVHLGQRSLGPAGIREIMPTVAALGVSVHSREEALAARDADYLFAGTIFSTPSHPGRAGAGVGRVGEVLDALAPGDSAEAAGSTGARSRTPVIAIGGMTPDRVPEVVAVGAHGVAVLRGVWDAEEPAQGVKAYLRALR